MGAVSDYRISEFPDFPFKNCIALGKVGRMERFMSLLVVAEIHDSSDEVGEWIPTQPDVVKACNDLRHSQNVKKQPQVRDIIPTSHKIGKRTFVEGCFDAILLVACWSGNVPVVSYLLTSYIQHFSIDTLVDKLATQIDHAPILYPSGKMKARFQQLQTDKVSLLHAAAEGLQLDVIKLLLSAGANVNNPSKWSITPLISALNGVKVCSNARSCRKTLACLIDSGANVNCRCADGMTPLMYAAVKGLVDELKVLIKSPEVEITCGHRSFPVHFI